MYTAAAAAKSLQSCPTPCDPIDGSPLELTKLIGISLVAHRIFMTVEEAFLYSDF